MSYFEEIQATVKAIKPELKNRFHVSSIGFFGSIVRNDFSLDKSDIDIIVDFSEPIGIEFIDLANYLEKECRRKVDLVSRKGIKNSYYSVIEKEIVYA